MSIIENLMENMQSFDKELKELKCHVNKIHDMVNLEDRITASDVLNRLTKLEDKIIKLESKSTHVCVSHYSEIIEEIEKFRRQNEKIINDIWDAIKALTKETAKNPYKCPICNGQESCCRYHTFFY